MSKIPRFEDLERFRLAQAKLYQPAGGGECSAVTSAPSNGRFHLGEIRRCSGAGGGHRRNISGGSPGT